MHNIIFTILVLIQAVFIKSVLADATETNWQLINDEEGIKVYILDTEYSDIIKAKTTTLVKAPLNKVKAILDDIDARHEWIPFLVKSKALSEYKNNKRIEYSHFSAPWPASDRDFIYEIELFYGLDRQLVYKMKSVESALKGEDNNKIRGILYESRYTLTPLDKETTVVELVYHADPKGWLPNWIINIIQQVLPYKILRNLKIRLNEK